VHTYILTHIHTYIYTYIHAYTADSSMTGPIFVISTREGDIKVRLREDAAPQHSAFMKKLIGTFH
jgi:hypothetical protein